MPNVESGNPASVRITGLSSLSIPWAYTSVVWAASVKLSGVYMLLILQVRSDVSGGGHAFDLTTLPFFDCWRVH